MPAGTPGHRLARGGRGARTHTDIRTRARTRTPTTHMRAHARNPRPTCAQLGVHDTHAHEWVHAGLVCSEGGKRSTDTHPTAAQLFEGRHRHVNFERFPAQSDETVVHPHSRRTRSSSARRPPPPTTRRRRRRRCSSSRRRRRRTSSATRQSRARSTRRSSGLGARAPASSCG